MDRLSKFVSKHYNVSESDLPMIVSKVRARLVDSDYEHGQCLSEYELYDLVDGVICDLDLAKQLLG